MPNWLLNLLLCRTCYMRSLRFLVRFFEYTLCFWCAFLNILYVFGALFLNILYVFGALFLKKRCRMNASDIVKAKQNKVLYSAYYRPTFLTSTNTSTITRIVTPYSSILSTASSVRTCSSITYNNLLRPTYTSYETLNQIRDGAGECGGVPTTSLQFTGVPTQIYAFNTIYSSFNNNQLYLPSSFGVTSTVASEPTGPLITPFISFHQGCNTCTPTTVCANCLL